MKESPGQGWFPDEDYGEHWPTECKVKGTQHQWSQRPEYPDGSVRGCDVCGFWTLVVPGLDPDSLPLFEH
eukprot:g4217.t1